MKLPRASTVVASVFGIGYFDVAPGTIMSAVAVPLAILIALHAGGGMGILASSIIVLVIGILACGDHVRETGRDDPSECVIDELAGQWFACSFCLLTFGGLVPAEQVISLPAFGLAFVFFRLFDIWKPWPVGWADQNLKGGLGVMTDDMIAGGMAGVLVVAARILFHI
ncbi:MAG: phosphatidylglycerophosphatase A [Alphaproteobacteria bacterium]|nr:phosphatidylglycerophosphatase A [Alphaproteobacteria bacterium]